MLLFAKGLWFLISFEETLGTGKRFFLIRKRLKENAIL
jgi:hypothetical protein